MMINMNSEYERDYKNGNEKYYLDLNCPSCKDEFPKQRKNKPPNRFPILLLPSRLSPFINDSSIEIVF